jgi:hypothetical protein
MEDALCGPSGALVLERLAWAWVQNFLTQEEATTGPLTSRWKRAGSGKRQWHDQLGEKNCVIARYIAETV